MTKGIGRTAVGRTYENNMFSVFSVTGGSDCWAAGRTIPNRHQSRAAVLPGVYSRARSRTSGSGLPVYERVARPKATPTVRRVVGALQQPVHAGKARGLCHCALRLGH